MFTKMDAKKLILCPGRILWDLQLSSLEAKNKNIYLLTSM